MTEPDVTADEPPAATDQVPAGTRSDDPRARRLRNILALVIASLGVPLGFSWVLVAPGREFRVLADGRYAGLPTADYHGFDATALFALAAGAIGLIGAVAAWRIRSIRGTATLIALTGATVAAGALAYLITLLPLRGTRPDQVGATGQDLLITAAPTLATPIVIVAAPLVAVITYTFMVAWDGRPDLGRRGSPPTP